MHTCCRSDASTRRKRRKRTTKLVSSIVQEDYPGVLKTPNPKSLIELVKGKASVDISYSTAWRGKNEAANVVRGNPEDSYQMLESYMYMLNETNEGTQTCVVWDEQRMFKYLFFALGACIEGFKVMRKVLVVDATHLKNAFGGVLIVATAQDPNHHHYPIDFGVVDGEKYESWMWFMEKLKLVVPDDDEIIFITDRNRSLIKSVRVVFPLSKHGYCIYHLSQNMKGRVYGTKKNTVVEKFM